ncbi:MAG: hypothetical protein AB7E05_03195 [Sphingobium sp.]
MPKQFLKTVKRTGLAAGLFYDMRFDRQGAEIADLVLCEVKAPSGASYTFSIGEIQKQRLLKGLDLIGDTLQFTEEITRFEARNARGNP